ncbi:MAG TPA: amidohydrolase family protein [Gaiellaceae bacterium]|nr:amidohydrolase family protein [Gaiellaceae bacterium]
MIAYTADWVLPVEGAPIERGGVGVEDGRIVAVGPGDELGGERRHFPGAAIVPGLVNAHTHLEYAVYAGFGDGLPFGPWLHTHIERKARIGWDEFVAIARLGAAESLAGGVTTVGDASFSGAAAVAAAELDLRAVVYLEVFGADPSRVEGRRARIEELEGEAGERVILGVSPHAPYSVSADVYRASYSLGRPVATHVAESDDETEFMLHGGGPIAAVSEIDPPGSTAVRHLAEHGLLEPRVVAAHCVKVDEEEIELLAEHDVAVAHCPRSNALLGCGVAPLRALLDAGLRVGLGTDSPASTPSLDMWEEMRAAVYAARARAERPDALGASEALELATLGSARALGLDGEIGSLAAGKRADLAVVSLTGSPYLPWEDPTVAVVFGGSPERVHLTLVEGEERYEKGGFEWHELRHSAAAARARMLTTEAPLTSKT